MSQSIMRMIVALTSFSCLGQKHNWMIHENLFASTNQVSIVSLTWENSKNFNITLNEIF